jgi:tetraacyldisaccharide 4'-kinase
VPVLCVGNLTVGGAGKTPVVLSLLRLLREQEVEAHCISRGYGGSSTDAARRVHPERDSAAEVGDEPLLIAREGACWVARRRGLAAQAALEDGAQILVMDDGLQNPTLEKTLSLLVVDGGFGFGNLWTLPAGALREPPSVCMARCDAVVLIGEDRTQVRALIPPELPVLTARLVPDAETCAFHGARLFAFAGIGRPEKFFITLREVKVDLVGTREFADHHPFQEAELQAMQKRAEVFGARLVTTEKDAARLPKAWRERVLVARVALEWDDPAALHALLAPLIESARLR